MVAFSDEEGVRFQSTFLGSRAFAGTLTLDQLAVMDDEGTSLRQVRHCLFLSLVRRLTVPVWKALIDNGAPSDETLLGASKSQGARYYLEAHIEQGPVLEGANQPLAAVTAIAGQTFLTVTMQGAQGHAGTVPMPMRHDTLAAASEIVATLERRCQGAFRTIDIMLRVPHTRTLLCAADGIAVSADDGLVCTVGRLSVWPGASNVIAGRVNVTIDIRSRLDNIRKGEPRYLHFLSLRQLTIFSRSGR